MNKAPLIWLLAFLMFLGVPIFGSSVRAQGEGIIIEGADYFTTATNEYSAELINRTKEVTSRVIVEYADFNSRLYLNESDGLDEAASIVTPRIVVEYADSNSWIGLNRSDGVDEAARIVTPRIMVEYADFNSWLDLNRSDGLNEAARTVTPRVMVEYADFAPVYELQGSATLSQAATNVTPSARARIIVEYADYVFSSADMKDPFPGPNISDVTQTPLAPNYGDNVEVSASIVDYAPIDEVLLSYTYASMWHNVTMSGFGDVFNSTIPAQPYGTLVQYRIYASDTYGSWATSGLYSYSVIDDVKPGIVSSRYPVQPRSNQAVKVSANVIEPADASGVKTVLMPYRVNGGSWWNTTMVFNSTLGVYEAIVPGQKALDTVEYFIHAEDNAGNDNSTEIVGYKVALAGDANLDHKVDVLDAACISAHWYPGPPIGPLGFDPFYDLNNDGYINIVDSAIVNADWGKSW